MTTITITIPDDRMTRLKEVAVRFGFTPEELVQIGLVELLARPEDDFRGAVDHVLNKNADLCRRLA